MSNLLSISPYAQIVRELFTRLTLAVPMAASFDCSSVYPQELGGDGLTPLATVLECEKNFPLSPGGLIYSGASLDLPGEKLLVTVALNPIASIFDVDSGMEEIIQVDNRLLFAWIDSETGAVFMQKLARDYDRESWQSGKQESETTELHCFRSLDDFRSGVTEWVYTGFTIRLFSIRYIPSFGVYFCSHPVSRLSTSGQVTILDRSGKKIGGFALPGDMLAVDATGDGLEVFVRRLVRQNGRKQRAELCSVPIRSDFSGVGKVNPLYPMGIGVPVGSSSLRMSDTRFFRLRGLKEGDISKFFHEVYPTPGYWSFEDLLPIRYQLDEVFAPYTLDMMIEDTKHLTTLDKLSMSRRLGNLNQLEAFEDSRAYEIFQASMQMSRSVTLFFNRHGEGGRLGPFGLLCSDGVFNEGRKLVVLSSFSPQHDRGRPGTLIVKVVALE